MLLVMLDGMLLVTLDAMLLVMLDAMLLVTLDAKPLLCLMQCCSLCSMQCYSFLLHATVFVALDTVLEADRYLNGLYSQFPASHPKFVASFKPSLSM